MGWTPAYFLCEPTYIRKQSKFYVYTKSQSELLKLHLLVSLWPIVQFSIELSIQSLETNMRFHSHITRRWVRDTTACMILDKSWDHPSNPLFKELNWLPLQSRITYHVALLVFKIHNDLAPNYLNTILLFTSNSRYELRSESRCNLTQPIKKSYDVCFNCEHI